MEMAGAESTLTRHDLEVKIVKRCWEDEAFREEFTADPAGAFVKYLGLPAASLPRITVRQEEPGSWHIVLPEKPVNASELSGQDLEMVAGGSAGALMSGRSVAVTPSIGLAAAGIGASGAVVASVAVSVEELKGW
jgi:hypothetical protein